MGVFWCFLCAEQVSAAAVSAWDEAGKKDEAESPPRIWGWVLSSDWKVRNKQKEYSQTNPHTHTLCICKDYLKIMSAFYFRRQQTLCFPTESVRKRIAPPWRRNIRNIKKSRPSSVSWRSCSANRKSPRPCDRKMPSPKNCLDLCGRSGLIISFLL